MPTEAVELLFRFKVDGRTDVEALKRALDGVTASVRNGDTVLKAFKNTTKDTTESLGAAVFKADLLARSFVALGSAVKNYVEDAARYAARTEQLATISDSLARINGLSVQGVRAQAAEVRQLGITTQVSLETTARLIQARIDVARAPQLARAAQDAAKIGGVSSSEALEKIITGIATGQVRPLHNVGLMVSFQQGLQEYANHIHKAVGALNQQEIAEARVQAVLKVSSNIYGTYEASLGTAAGQMQSLSRYTDELKNKFGEGLQPVLFSIIGTMRYLSITAGENIDKFQHLTAGAAALGVAGGVFAATGFLPLPYRAGAAALAGGAAYLATDQDPAQTQINVTRDQLREINAKQAFYQRETGIYQQTGGKDGADYSFALRNPGAGPRLAAEEAKLRLATIYGQRQSRGEFIVDTSRLTSADLAAASRAGLSPEQFARGKGYTTGSAYPSSVDFGGGITITGDQFRHALDRDPGGNLKPAPVEDDDATKALVDLVKERGKALRSQLNGAKLQLLSGTSKIALQQRFATSELAHDLQSYTPAQLASAGAGSLYGLIAQVGASETTKYRRDQRLEAIGFGGEVAFDSRAVDGKRKRPGDLSDVQAQYQSAISIADRKRAAGATTDDYNKAVYAATGAYFKGKRSADEAGAQATIEGQVGDVRSASSLQLRLLGIGKTPENSGSLNQQEYQLRVQAASEEYSKTADIKQLRADISAAWADKIVGAADIEHTRLEKQKQDRIALIQSEGQFRSRLSSVQADPQDQFTAIRDAYRDRLDTALKVFEIDRKGDDLKKASLEAEHEMVISIAEIRQRSIKEYEANAGKIFDALVSRNKGASFRSLLLGQVETAGRTAFTNLAGLTYGKAENLGLGNLIHGQYQTNPDGSPKIDPKTGNPTLTTIGKILAGGPLGVNQAKLAGAGITNPSVHVTELNTTSTNRNTDAIDRLTARIDAILGAGRGGLSTAIHSIGGPSFSGSTVSAGVSNVGYAAATTPRFSTDSSISYDNATFPPQSFSGDDNSAFAPDGSAAATTVAPDDTYTPDQLPNRGLANTGLAPGYTVKGGGGSIAGPLFNPNASTSSRALSGIATAGALYEGTLSVIHGIRKGGAQGYLGAVGSAAGTAAALDPEPVSKAILAGVALGSQVVSAIIGDPKQNFVKKQAQLLQDNHYFGPQQLSISSDTAGNATSYGFKGNARSSDYSAYSFAVDPTHYDSNHNIIPGSVTPTNTPSVVINADFIDPAGLQSRSNDIASAVQTAMLRGHPINDTVAQTGK